MLEFLRLPRLIFSPRFAPASAALLTALALATTAVPAEAQDEPEITEPEPIPTEDCMECHSKEDLEMDKPDGTKVSMFVSESILKSSVHGDLDCADCHEDLTDKHPDDEVPAKPVNCAECHEEQTESHAASIHAPKGESAGASCIDCHGQHDMLGYDNPNSPTYKLNLPRTCAKCHTTPGLTDDFRLKHPEVASQFRDSIHSRGVVKMGLTVAPSCSDCHGVHDITRHHDPDSPVHKARLATTCGKCHTGVEETYNKSTHGRLLLEGNPDAPVCTDCHTGHLIELNGEAHTKIARNRSCGKCHSDSLEQYHDTYHGKAMELGKPGFTPEVAACYECHGAHDILPASNPDSPLSQERILATCQKCHPDATVGFTKYIPHADPMDGENYPWINLTFLLMTGLLLGVFFFFGGHTVSWIIRSGYLYFKNPKKFREAKLAGHHDTECFTRFTPFERFLHMLVMTSFLLLVITGMPLKFYYTDWAKTIFTVLGGADAARGLHRFGAIVSFLYFGLHLISIASSCWKKSDFLRNPETGRWQLKRFFKALFGPDSMVPSWQDWKDFVAHNKWFFGKGEKPQFDRWTYWERFDYLAVFWGMFMIGLSGLVMWFPQFFTSFLPGWIINIALIVHSDEALLAAGFIFTFHFFNTHLRLERFPMDKVIFSGRISKVEMTQERQRWYDRLKAEGRLDLHRIGDEWQSWKKIVGPIGYTFLGISLILLALIIYAMASHLL